MKRGIELALAVVLLVLGGSASTGTAAGSGSQGEQSGRDEVQRLLGEITPEKNEQIVRQTVTRRLQLEREQVAEEIRRNILYSDAEVAGAIVVLDDHARNTRQDNIERICKAFAMLDASFAQAHDLMHQGQHREAAEELRKLIHAQELNYFGATKMYVYASCLAESGDPAGALEAYAGLLGDMPDRISFAATAASDTAAAYEQLRRERYALQMYRYVLQNYSPALSDEDYFRISEKIRRLQSQIDREQPESPSELDDLRTESAEPAETLDTAESEIAIILSDLLDSLEQSPALSDETVWSEETPGAWEELAPEQRRMFRHLGRGALGDTNPRAVDDYVGRLEETQDAE
ncbi:MAG: tetratricopeptide repeat protein [Phycisphaerae bacterium]